MYELYDQLKHLPLNVLDIWKCIVNVPEALTTYLFSLYSNPEVLTKLTDSYNVRWRLIPIRVWEQAFDGLRKYLIDTGYEEIAEELIQEKLNTIEALGMPEISQILRGEKHQVAEEQCRFLMNLYVNGVEGNPGIRGRHAEGIRWETNASDFIIEKFIGLPLTLRKMLPLGLPKFQQPVLYLPFIVAYHSVIGDYIHINELDGITRLGITVNINFDQSYFEGSYALLLNYCLQHYANH
jgi:hypothetical protein